MQYPVRYFKNDDGNRLAYRFVIKQESNPGIFIIIHGALSHMDVKPFPGLSNYLPYNTFRFDVTGAGKSDGQWIPHNFFGELRDLRSAVVFVRSQGYEVLGIIGHSRGASITMQYSYRYRDVPLYIGMSGGYETWREFITNYYPDVYRFGHATYEFANKKYKIKKDEFEVLKEWKISEAIYKHSGNIYMLQGEADATFPVQYTMNRVARFIGKQVEDFYIIADGDHNFRINPSEMHYTIKKIIEEFYKHGPKLSPKL
jgi:hypothetical protein